MRPYNLYHDASDDTYSIIGPTNVVGIWVSDMGQEEAAGWCEALNDAYASGRSSLMPLVDALYDEMDICQYAVGGSSCGECSRCQAVAMYLAIGKETNA